jgi:hypothetical protein
MTKRDMFFSALLTAVVAMLILVAVAAGAELPAAQEPPTLPLPIIPTSPAHAPYDPFRRPETLPRYPAEPLLPPSQSELPWTKPEGIDLDVTYISRAPMFNRYEVWYTPDGKPYLRPGTENDQRWPNQDELVTFTAHVMNKGTVASGSYAFKWLIDDVQVASGTHPGLVPGQEATTTYQWTWDHTVADERLLGQHTVEFVVDPEDAIAETYESNNSHQDRTDALSLVLALTPELYDALETPIDPMWPFSAEDWLQKQIAAMNEAFARSGYPVAPNGVVERVRLDNILVTSAPPPVDWSEDGGFFMAEDDRFGNAYYDPETDVSGALLHELTHQLGIIDMYNLDVPLEVPQVLDKNSRPVQMEFWAVGLYPGLMGDPGTRPPFYSEHTALALNANKGYRRGYYGEYLYDVPEQTHLRILDNQGDPSSGVTINLYQMASSPNMMGSLHGVIDNTPEISVETDAAGLALLPNRPVGDPVWTHTGHILTDNPFGVIDVVGRNDEFLVEIRKDLHQEFLWLDITRFNLAAWNGETTIAIQSHVPPAGVPPSPDKLHGTLEYGRVKLQWQEHIRTTSSISSYNVYQTEGPAAAWTRIVTGTTAQSCDLPFDYGVRASGYAVTAEDNSGTESGFGDLFWALRLRNPAAIAVDEHGQRVVLDPQNGYALLLQSPEGQYFDTMGSYDLHLEFSNYMARAENGRLIISHPADYYSSRHSVRVTDHEANLAFEFGEQGSDPGQFETPSGVAVWGDPCTFGGPYTTDAHTLLLLHFDGSYTGDEGEPGTPNGTDLVVGKFDQGVQVDATDTLVYETVGNLEREQGAIEFWVKPQWDGDDGQSYTLFEVGNTWFNRMRIMKDGANNLRFMVWDSTTEYGVAYNIGHWQAGEWHHVAATWQAPHIALFVDGQERDSRDDANVPDTLADLIYLGSSSWPDQQADAVLDEVRISDIPRIGNSDVCLERILVADSGNHRLQAFTSDGSFVSTYGSYGNSPGQFDNPQGLAVDHHGNIILVDSGNNRLQVLSFDGTSFGFHQSIMAGFNAPTGVVACIDNRILVADTGNHSVKMLDEDGNLLAEYTSPDDTGTDPFVSPRGVLGLVTGDIVVADTGNSRVVTIVNDLHSQGIALTPGWNPVTWPLEPLPDAETALAEIEAQGGDASEACRWLSESDTWECHTKGQPENNFSLELGRGYFFQATTASNWQRSGFPPPDDTRIELQPTWTLMGLPQPPERIQADALLTDMTDQGGDCTELHRWADGRWEGHVRGLPFNDFYPTNDEGYFVKCANAITYAPTQYTVRSQLRALPAPLEAGAMQPAADPAISDVLVTSRHDAAASVTWRTDLASVGWVEYGETPDLGRAAYQDIGTHTAVAARRAHHVTLRDLSPETTYYFRVHSGDAVDDNGGQLYQVTTGATELPLVPYLAYGQVETSDGGPAVGALVRAWLLDGGGGQSEPLSTLVDASGYWSLNLPLDDCAGMDLKLEAIGVMGGEAELTLPACEVRSVPTIVLP